MAKKTITITAYVSEIIYDAQNKTYLTGRSRQNGTNQEEVAHMQLNEDEENENQLLRSIGNAFANLKTQMSEYIEESGTTGDNVLMDKATDIKITLSMPNNYNQSTIATISSAVHQYLVNTAVAEWFTITNKADAADYVTLATANLSQIRDAINRRVRPVRTNPTE